MAKKPDLSVVKTFLFNHGERVALIACIAVALLLIVWGLSGAMGPGTASGKPWQVELTTAAKNLKQQIPPANDFSDEEKNKIVAEVKFPPVSWDRFASLALPGPYQNINELPSTQRNNPTIFNVLTGDENFQMDYLDSWQYYKVLNGKVLAIKGAVADKKGAAGGAGGIIGPPGIGPMGLGGSGGMFGIGGAGGGGGAGNLAHVLQPKHMLVVTGIFPMKKQVDEYVKALRMRDVSELAAANELPKIAGINVFREEYGPDGKRTHTEQALPLIFYNPEKKKLEIQKALEKELAEAVYEQSNPRTLRPVIHEGLVTPLPLLPEGHLPKLHIKGDYWPREEMVADAGANPETPGMPPMGPMGLPGGAFGSGRFGAKGGPGFKGGSAAGQPSILGKGSATGPMNPPGMPGMQGGGNEPAADVPTEMIPLKNIQSLDKDLYARLAERRFNIFHPFGQFPTENAPAANAGGATMPGMPSDMSGGFGAQQGAGGSEHFGFGATGAAGGGPLGGTAGVIGPPMMSKPGGKTTTGPMPGDGPIGPGGSPGASATLNIYDAIVRFVDVDVKPLHSYRYYIQVRVKNPNFGKKNDVSQMIFAEIKELRSEGDWTPTPLFTVPGTYQLFAVDQFRVDHLGEKEKSAIDKLKPSHTLKSKEDAAVVQVHRWLAKSNDGDLIGNWTIAEWLKVRKGEAIGSANMIVEVPTWNVGRGAFEMRSTLPPVTKGKAKAAQKGVPVDLVPKVDMPPLLVDFDGGRRDFRLPTGPITDDAAMDLLILTPEGRLIVRNSRADIDAEIYDGSLKGMTRQARVEHWRKRNHEAQAGGGPPAAEGAAGGNNPILGR